MDVELERPITLGLDSAIVPLGRMKAPYRQGCGIIIEEVAEQDAMLDL